MNQGTAAFLFGSGISRASNGPSVECITDLVLNGSFPDQPRCAQEFLGLVQAEINDHLKRMDGRDANYEDLYAAVYQIFQDLTGDITSPLIGRSTASLTAASVDLLPSVPQTGWEDPFIGLCWLSNRLIQSVVCRRLREIGNPKQLEMISEVARQTQSMDIFTLNHDLLVETALAQNKIQCADGFDDVDGGLARFSGSWSKKQDGVRLFKLHGSLNWYRFRFKTETHSYDQYARVDGDYQHCRLANGKFANHLSDMPEILTGTTVKEQAYGLSFFGDLFRAFHDYVARHDTLICCGYGWGDKGINHRLNQWLHDGVDHRIVILHNDPGEVIGNKRFWGFRWDDYTSRGKVILVEKWLSECSFADLEPYFDGGSSLAPHS